MSIVRNLQLKSPVHQYHDAMANQKFVWKLRPKLDKRAMDVHFEISHSIYRRLLIVNYFQRSKYSNGAELLEVFKLRFF